jgi:hypothetical protein
MLGVTEVWIWIDRDGTVQIDCDPVILKKDAEEVVWRIRPGYHSGMDKVTIRFSNAAPFVQREFYLPLGGSISSGPAGFSGDFKYDIEVLPHNGSLKVRDPRVIVEDPKPSP